MVQYLFLDESGDLGHAGSKYFIMVCLVICEPRLLDRIIKNMRRNKFNKHLRAFEELKASKLPSDIILYALKNLSALSHVTIFGIYFKKNEYSKLNTSDKQEIYNLLATKLAELMVVGGIEIEVRIDKSKSKQKLENSFNIAFERHLRKHNTIFKMNIHHSHSQSWSGLQFADLVAWALFQKMEHNNSDYVNVLTIPIVFRKTAPI